MRGGKSTRPGVVAVIMCVLLVGCVGMGELPSRGVDAARLRPRPRPIEQPPAEQTGTDLRIPVETVARGQDIPLVPVPPPPLGRSTNPPQTPPGNPITPPVVATTPPTSSPSVPPAQSPSHTARQLLQQAAARYAGMDSYITRLVRREFLKGNSQPEEILLFKFRKNPWSVHFKWLGDTAKGREVVYVKGRYEDKIHTKLAAGDAPLMPAGARIAVAPNSILARSASRHPITDAGIGHCIDSLLAQLNAQERGDRREGTLTAIAPQRRPEYPQPVETIERTIAPGAEPELPRGGRRLICFDPDWQLPLLVVTYDDKGREVEYYRYDRIQAPVNLDDDDFNPDKLWATAPPKSAPAGSR
jgi:hypothetical protein